MGDLVVYIFVFVVTTILTSYIRKYAIKNRIIDIPNNRSSHTIPTPRGGGLSIVIVFIVSVLIILVATDNSKHDLIMSIAIGGSLVAAVGLWDDYSHVAAKWRFLVHLIASIFALSLIRELPSISFFSFKIELAPFAILFYSVALVWLINLYNFMDGIDGIASIEAITVLVGAVFILILQNEFTNIKLLLLLLSSVAGFLIWNWPPAKIFMGDACSGFLGLTIGIIAIWTSTKQPDLLLNLESSRTSSSINLWSWLILLGVFVVDATVTLVRRLINGDKWCEAHRSHTYQILARKFKSHKKITMGVLVINSFWLFPLAYLASIYEYWAPLLALIATLPIIIVACKVEAGIQCD